MGVQIPWCLGDVFYEDLTISKKLPKGSEEPYVGYED